MPIKLLVPESLGTAVLVPGQPGAAGGPGGAPAPNFGAGWELGVYNASTTYSTLLCMVPTRLWTSFTFSKLLSDKGSGTVILNTDDAWWTSTTLTGGLAPHYILDEEHVWRVFQDGVARFEFLGETITEQLVDPSEQRLVTVTGPGTINVLSWAMAAPPGFPSTIVYKTDALSDDFSAVDVNGNYVIDYGLWNASSNTSDISVNPAGSAQLTATSGGTVLGTTEWDFTSTLFSVQVNPIVSPDQNNVTLNGSELTQLFMEALDGSGDYVMMALSSTSLYAQYKDSNGTSTQVIASAATYAAGMSANYQYSYWQISEANGVFYFWTSSDGQTWAKVWQINRNWDSSRVGVYFAAAYSGSTVESATFTSLNSDVVTSSLGGATYLDEPIMSIYLQTLQAAATRGTVPFVVTQATETQDSFGTPWSDSQSVQIQNGTDLFSLLQGHTSMVDADFIMEPGFKLVVGLPAASTPNEGQVTLGYDRSNAVRFYEGERVTLKQRQRQRQQIQNLIAAINADSITVTSSDAGSIATWGQREAWIQAAAQVTTSDLDVVASAASQQNADEVLSWTLQILPWATNKTVFKDFAVGDWIGLERPDFSAVDVVRVIGITVSVDQDGNETHELVLESYVQWLEQRLTYIATKMGGGFVSANGTTAVSDNAQGSTLQAPTVFNPTLSSLGVPTSSGGTPLVYNPVTGQWVPAGSTDPTTGAEVGVSVPGSGGQVSINGNGVTAAVSPSTTTPLNTNPVFTGGSLTGWTGVNATIAAVSPAAGLPSQTEAAQITPTGSSTALLQAATANASVQGGVQYTLYAFAYLPTQANMGITTEISWYSATGALIQTDGLSTVIPASQWVQVAYQDQAPAGAVTAKVAVGITSGSSGNPGQVAQVQLVPGATNAGSSASSTSVTPTGTTVVDSTGSVRIVAGLQGDGTVTTNYYNGLAPGTPDTPTVAGSMLGLTVTWDGLLAGAAPLSDFLYVAVYVSSTSGFTPSSANLYTVIGAGGGSVVIGQLLGGTTYYVKLVAVNESGANSAASTQASAVAQTVPANIPTGGITSIMLATGVAGSHVTIAATAPSSPATNDLWYDTAAGNELFQWNGTSWQPYQYGTSAIAAGSVTATLIAANTITAGQIASATITSLQIAANTITASNIVSGTITATQIAGTTITAAQIASGTITTTQIASGTITASNIHSATITGTLIAAGTITATNIAAGTITGTQIAASVSLTSPVITGGTITGGQIIADGSSGQILVYAGTPTSGNLLVALSGAAGTDGSGNPFGNGITLTGTGTTPTAISGSAILYGTAAGSLQCVDGLDGNVYQTQRLTQILPSNVTLTTTTLTTLFNINIGMRNYRITAWLVLDNNTANSIPSVKLAAPGTSGGQMSCILSRAASLYNMANFGINATTGMIAMPITGSGGVYVMQIDGLLEPSSAGSFSLQLACSSGGSFTVVNTSFIDVTPI